MAAIPPDGGWGWVVVFASFMIHVIADGVTYTFGIFFYEILQYFGESKGRTAWVASIMCGTTYCIGPLASGLTNKYGCRTVTVAGALLATSGLVLSIFAPNVLYLFFTIGLFTGAGLGLVYLPSIVSVTCYFEKKRAFATGMAVCGSGIGTFALAPLIEYLVDTYDWKGAMLIIAALVLNCAVFGALFRPLESSSAKKLQKNSGSTTPNSAKSNGYVAGQDAVPLMANGHKGVKSTSLDIVNFRRNSKLSNGFITDQRRKRDASPLRNSLTIPEGYCTMPSTPLVEEESKKLSVTSIPALQVSSNGHIANGQLPSNGLLPTANHEQVSPFKNASVIPSDFLRRKVEGSPLSSFVCSSASLAQTNKELCQLESMYSEPLTEGLMYRKDIFYSGSLQNIAKYRSHPNISYSSVVPNDSRRVSRFHSESSFRCCPREVRDALLEMTDFSLLRDPVFLMFGISNFLTSIGFNAPYVYTKDRVADMGIEGASILLSLIGISNTVGRITLGYLSDRSWVNRLYIYNSSLLISGLATALSCYALDYTQMAVYCITFGITTGAYVSLTSVILVDLLGLDKLTNAFGLLLVFQGVATLIGPPITGWLYDALGSYDPGFYVAGAMISVSGLMLFLVPCIQKPSSGSPDVIISDDSKTTKQLVDTSAC